MSVKNSSPAQGEGSWAQQLIELLRTMPEGVRCAQRPKPSLEEYAWKESEEAYQRAQARWLAGRRTDKDRG